MAAKKRQKSVAPAQTYEIPQLSAADIASIAAMALGQAPSVEALKPAEQKKIVQEVVQAVVPEITPQDAVAAAAMALGQAPTREAVKPTPAPAPAQQEIPQMTAADIAAAAAMALGQAPSIQALKPAEQAQIVQEVVQAVVPEITPQDAVAAANMALGQAPTSEALTGQPDTAPAEPVPPASSDWEAAARQALGQPQDIGAATGNSQLASGTPQETAPMQETAPTAPMQETAPTAPMQETAPTAGGTTGGATNETPQSQVPTGAEPTTPGATRPSSGMTYDNLVEFLSEYGLGGGEIPRLLRAAIEDDPTQFSGPFAQQAVFRTVRNTTEYKERFKGLKMRQDAGLPPISEAQYIAIENDYRRVLRGNGMPKGFYDTEEDFAKFIGGDIRADELNTRIQAGFRAVTEAEPGTKDELKRLYGIDENKLAAYFLDPARAQTELVKSAEAARRANAAREQGIQIQAGTAEELVTRGISQREASQGFQAIAEQQGLVAAQRAGATAITQEEQIGAAFGTSAAAAQRIATRRRRRQAEFEAGGGFAAGQRGVAGLGTANQ